MSDPSLAAWLDGMPPDGRPPTIIRTYRSTDASAAAAEMSREAEVLARHGYVLVGQIWEEGRPGCLAAWLLGVIALSDAMRPQGKLVATFARAAQPEL